MMRYKIVFATEYGIVALCDSDLARAIGYARRISEGDWWEVIDMQTKNLVASSDTEMD